MTVDLEQKQRDIEKYEESIYYSARYAGACFASDLLPSSGVES